MTTIRIAIHASLAFAALSSYGGPIVNAQETPKEPVMDARADEVIDGLSRYMASLRSLRAETEMRFVMTSAGMSQKVVSSFTLAMERPNKVALRLTKGTAGTTICSDGRELRTYVLASNQYMVVDGIDKLDDMPVIGGGGRVVAMAMGCLNLPFVGMLLPKNPRPAILESVTRVQYLGVEPIKGTDCHRLRFEHPEFDWEMWVRVGEQPWVMKYRLDLAKAMSALQSSRQGANIRRQAEASITFRDWEANVELPEETFQFTPPAGADVANMGDIAIEDCESFIGKKAPRTILRILDGDLVPLTAAKRSRPVILEFWATWCGPCRRSLETLNGLTKTYRAKGVDVYLVNQMEDEKEVRAFVAKAKLSWPVAMDRKGRLGKKYGVRGIPHTVIIDQYGVVQAVHVGFAPDLEEVLSKELNTLLDGKKLVPSDDTKPSDSAPDKPAE